MIVWFVGKRRKMGRGVDWGLRGGKLGKGPGGKFLVRESGPLNYGLRL
jgi:hypothetical protein